MVSTVFPQPGMPPHITSPRKPNSRHVSAGIDGTSSPMRSCPTNAPMSFKVFATASNMPARRMRSDTGGVAAAGTMPKLFSAYS